MKTVSPNAVKEWCHKNRIKQKWLIEKLGISRTTLWAYLNGVNGSMEHATMLKLEKLMYPGSTMISVPRNECNLVHAKSTMSRNYAIFYARDDGHTADGIASEIGTTTDELEAVLSCNDPSPLLDLLDTWLFKNGYLDASGESIMTWTGPLPSEKHAKSMRRRNADSLTLYDNSTDLPDPDPLGRNIILITCAKCGKRTPDPIQLFNYCAFCGESLRVSCKSCGWANEFYMRFCRKCGDILSDNLPLEDCRPPGSES